MKRNMIATLSIIAMSIVMLGGCASISSIKTTEETTLEESTKATEESSEEIIGMPNPWTESDKEGVLAATGFEMNAPAGATDVAYSYMEDGKLAQMTYKLDDIDWVYRIQPADELTDISGLYYDWDSEAIIDGDVAGYKAVYYSYIAPEGSTEDSIQMVNWYDAITGVTYSLSAVAKDVDGMDIQAYAESIYSPLQGDATDDPEADRKEELDNYFLGEHKKSDDESMLTISDNNDETFAIDIIITRLCNLEGGVGTFSDHKMYFDIDDPNGGTLSGMIYRDSDNSLDVKFTKSTWALIPNDETFEGFGK